MRRNLSLCAPILAALIPVSPACAADLKVVTSGAFTAAFTELAPLYSRDRIVLEFGPSMGTTYNAIPMRMERGEEIDVVVLAASALADLIRQGKVLPESRVDLIESKIGMAVKASAPPPDIGSLDALKRTLLAAKSIGVSDSASGVYLSTELFPRLGIADEIRARVRKIEADPVGEFVARGEVEIGFQQVSELRPVKGIRILEVPDGAQRLTVFAAGIPVKSRHREEARELIRWLASPEAWAVMRKSGVEPIRRD
jgi:molybdate transport system substrate-binding protein